MELTSADETYAWDRVESSDSFQRLTLFTDRDVRSHPSSEVLRRVIEVLSEIRPDAVAIAGWSEVGALAALHWCLTTNTAAVVMSETTRGDHRRWRWREALKKRLVSLYSAGLVGGQPQNEYLVSLGMSEEQIFFGYDVVDNAHFAAGADVARQHAAELRKEHELPELYSSRQVD